MTLQSDCIEIRVKPSPTQDKFINSTATVDVLRGPQGEGKTWAIPWRQIKRYQKNGHKLRGLLVRDTLENILSKTVLDIKASLDPIGSYPIVRDKKHMTYNGFPDLHVELVGMNDRSSLNRIQGGGYNDVSLEEVAPVFEQGESGASLGIPMEAFLTALSRASREGYGQVGVTMNPGSEDHWSHILFITSPLQPCEEWPDISTELFDIPYGENSHLTNISRQATRAAYSQPGMEAYYRRYIEGKSSYMLKGKPVVPNYVESNHFCKKELFPIQGVQIIRLWDGGLNPTCTFCQITPLGFFQILDCFITENEGLKQLIDRFICPALGNKYASVTDWRDIGDPAMNIREQSDSNQSAEIILKKELGANFEMGEKYWEPRRRSIINLCGETIAGQFRLQVSRSAVLINQALRGGWHYKTNSMGQIMEIKGRETLPVKDKHSHPGDTLGHGLPKIFPKVDKNKRPRREPPRTMLSRIHRRKQVGRRLGSLIYK
jgi:hypothetical protein